MCGREYIGWRGIKGGKWENCNIINKISLKLKIEEKTLVFCLHCCVYVCMRLPVRECLIEFVMSHFQLRP